MNDKIVSVVGAVSAVFGMYSFTLVKVPFIDWLIIGGIVAVMFWLMEL